MKCKRWKCENYGEVDDGEDADGFPYPPCPMCYSGGQMCGLPEEWMGDTDCIGNFEPRVDYSAVAVAVAEDVTAEATSAAAVAEEKR